MQMDEVFEVILITFFSNPETARFSLISDKSGGGLKALADMSAKNVRFWMAPLDRW